MAVRKQVLVRLRAGKREVRTACPARLPGWRGGPGETARRLLGQTEIDLDFGNDFHWLAIE